MHVNLHQQVLVSTVILAKTESRYTSDSPVLKKEHSSCSDVPVKVIKKS